MLLSVRSGLKIYTDTISYESTGNNLCGRLTNKILLAV